MNSLYENWIPEFLPGALPAEPLADCASCPMCATQEEGPEGQPPIVFLPSVKCCTHYPVLPNFLVGGILASRIEVMPSLPAVERLIRGRQGVYPAALMTAMAFLPDSLRLKDSPRLFGRLESSRCPFLQSEQGTCGIWAFRYSACATWFCRFQHRKRGHQFWKRLRDLCFTVERILSAHCMRQLGAPPDSWQETIPVIKGDIPADLMDPTLAAIIHSRWWGAWEGREEAFYQGCWEMVRSLKWSDVLRIGGGELEPMAQQLRRDYEDLDDPKWPDSVTLGHIRLRDLDEETSLVWSYSLYHPMQMPRPLAHLLKRLSMLESMDETRSLLAKTLALLPEEIRWELLGQGVLKEGLKRSEETDLL